MSLDKLRQEMRDFLGFAIPETRVPFTIHDADAVHGYRRLRISYSSQEGESIPAFLLLPGVKYPPGGAYFRKPLAFSNSGENDILAL
jgi:hypothetical protein